MTTETAIPQNALTPYRVLARKYRPAVFEELIGQKTLIQTLSNAISSGRLAHGFMLTGVRGVGKTTTARLLAKALNCTGPDGKGQPTMSPCGQCNSCQMIPKGRHIDVLEMDAASRTGIEDIKELIETVRYRPTSARYKIYIIDEIHMLSTKAFNALLKTLEEPPEHVKFIFATTEIRKVPITVLSRCQRFDLRRVPQETLERHFRNILEKENVTAQDEGLALIAKAADGSVRDGLSLLDQAIALSGEEIQTETVKSMMGLADRSRIFDLYEALVGGRFDDVLDLVGTFYALGAEPALILRDLLDITHDLTRLRLTPATSQKEPEDAERKRSQNLASSLPISHLTRLWQVMLQGVKEIDMAPNARQALEMLLVRLSYAAQLPSPDSLIESLKNTDAAATPSTAGSSSAGSSSMTAQNSIKSTPTQTPETKTEKVLNLAPDSPPETTQHSPETSAHQMQQQENVQNRSEEPHLPNGTEAQTALPAPSSLLENSENSVNFSNFDPSSEQESHAQEEILVSDKQGSSLQLESYQVLVESLLHEDPLLAYHMENDLRIQSYTLGSLAYFPLPFAPQGLAASLKKTLEEKTHRPWTILVSEEDTGLTLKEEKEKNIALEKQHAQRHPVVQKVLSSFEGAELKEIRPLTSDALSSNKEKDSPPSRILH